MIDKTYEQILVLELARQCGASVFKSNNGDRLYTTVTFDIEELQVFADLTAAHPAPPKSKLLLEHSGCGRGTQVDQITVRINPGDKVMLVMGNYSSALDADKDKK